MITLTLVPEPKTFVTRLKEALADNQDFVFRRVPWGEEQVIPKHIIYTIIYILDRVEEFYRDELLELIPLRIPELAHKCWHIKHNQTAYPHIFRTKEPVSFEGHQYEFEFIRRKENEPERYDFDHEGCPFCGHKAHRPAA